MNLGSLWAYAMCVERVSRSSAGVLEYAYYLALELLLGL
jgi:hypothetical protein